MQRLRVESHACGAHNLTRHMSQTRPVTNVASAFLFFFQILKLLQRHRPWLAGSLLLACLMLLACLLAAAAAAAADAAATLRYAASPFPCRTAAPIHPHCTSLLIPLTHAHAHAHAHAQVLVQVKV